MDVIVYEYDFVSKGGKKDEIVCPKCHKVICSSEEAGYYRSELYERVA